MADTDPTPTPPPAPTPAPAPVVPSTPPPGWKTSEAWFSFLVIVLGAIPSSGLVAGAPLLAKIVGMVTAAITTLNYVAHRTSLKRAYLAHAAGAAAPPSSRLPQLVGTAALVALVLLIGLTQSGCGANCQDPKNALTATCVVEGSVVDCTGVSSLASTVTVVTPIVDGLLLSATAADGTIVWASIESQLIDLALKYGTCVIADIWNAYIHGTVPGAGAGSGSAPAPTPSVRPRLTAPDYSAEFERIRAKVAPGRKFKTRSGTL